MALTYLKIICSLLCCYNQIFCRYESRRSNYEARGDEEYLVAGITG